MRGVDISGAVALQKACFPPPFPEELHWTEEHLKRHLGVFAEGQFVARADGTVIGSASALRISNSLWQSHADWETTTGGPFLNSHIPSGETLYAVDISVHPDWRGRGVGRALYEARFELVRRLGLVRLGTACRIPGYLGWGRSTGGKSEDYVKAVANGQAVDSTLTTLLRYGMKPIGVIENYMEDEESANAAALLEWTP